MIEPDESLVRRAQQDDRVAFGVLYERYLARVYSYVYYRTGNAHDAEDITEKVFLQALTHIGGYRYRGLLFSAWLLTIAHNLVANWHRDKSRHPMVSLDNTFSQDGPDFGLADAEDNHVVRQAVATLPPERQHLLLLKFVEEMSNADIGRVMGRSEGAVKALLHRTLRSLAATLKARENGIE